jgi:hypothetical protein
MTIISVPYGEVTPTAIYQKQTVGLMGAHGNSSKQRDFLCKEDHNEIADVT